jgi:hypothetical protein
MLTTLNMKGSPTYMRSWFIVVQWAMEGGIGWF